MNRLLAALVATAALAGCGTRPYQPQEYPLRAGLIPQLAVSGNVQVGNMQPSTEQTIVYSFGGTQLASSYRDITQAMVDQTKKEIAKNGKASQSGKTKNLDLKVTHLRSTYVAYFWKSEIRYTATLGSSGTLEKTVTHGSGDLRQDLNGCIAEAVMNLLNDPKVIAYLAE